MVVAKVRIAVEDPLVAARYGFRPEVWTTGEEPFLLDGPIAARVAVIDRDPSSGQVSEGVPWLPAKGAFAAPEELSAPEAMSVSVFGIVLETLAMFEREDVLGHKIRWAFDSPQLLVVPRAGTWANAFYDRYSRGLQFFSFEDGAGRTVHTALSRDIVAHETGHAILDGLAPALYDALSPESLGLHEAVGDLTAIVMALESRAIREWLVTYHAGRLDGDTPVSQLATEFGWAEQLNRPLRNANNSLRMDQVGQEPHRLCEVLTGAVWSAMVQLHAAALKEAHESSAGSNEAPLGRALWISARRIGRILFRALDYLPPAEATFADYARALLRSDGVAYPDDETGYRDTLQRQFLERGIVAEAGELRREPPKSSVRVDLDDVLESDWVAYAFAERERELLGIPAGVPFRLFPRRDVKRRYYLGGGRHEVRRELVFQVTWEESEPNAGIPTLPALRAVFRGTTLVLAGEPDSRGEHAVLSCLASDRAERHARARNDLARQLVEDDRLGIADYWPAQSLRPLAPAVYGRVTHDTLRLRGTARLLHLAGAAL